MNNLLLTEAGNIQLDENDKIKFGINLPTVQKFVWELTQTESPYLDSLGGTSLTGTSPGGYSDGNPSKLGTCVYMDGTTNLAGPTIAGNNLTINVWFKQTSVTGNRTNRILGAGQVTTNRLELSPMGANLYYSIVNTATSSVSGTLTSCLTANSWNMLTIMLEYRDLTVNNAIFYTNGAYVSAASFPTNKNGFNFINFKVGSDHNGDNKFIGYVSQVLVYDRVLTEEEIGTIYNLGNGQAYP